MNKYNTNITKLTCSCSDWKMTRIQYSRNDPRRLCKHIINKININNLPVEILKFKESIEFYQKKEWGFKRNFNEIIELDNFTLLGDFDWIDVFDKDGNRYGYLNDSYTGKHQWSKQNRPNGYEEIEFFFSKRFDTTPLPLQGKEKQDMVKAIKSVHNIKFSIEDQYNPSPNGIEYSIIDLIDYYPMGNIIVKNNEIIVEIYLEKTFQLIRDYKYAKSFFENEKQKEQKRLDKEKQKYQEELEQKRRIAIEKGYILTQDYKGDLYDIEDTYTKQDSLSLGEYDSIRKSIIGKYDTLKNLLRYKSSELSINQVNNTLRKLDFIMKEALLNQNDWIIKGNGLKYGINLVKKSKYMHESIPEWYKVKIFDNLKMELINLDSHINIKITSVLFLKNKFNELFQLVIEQIEYERVNNKGRNTIQNSKQLEREKWLYHVNCPNCGEKTNIHKKDKRKRIGYTVQRFYCNECNSMFQMNLDELEKLIQEYEKEKSAALKKIEKAQVVVKKEIEPVETSNNEEKESNLFKKFFSFFK